MKCDKCGYNVGNDDKFCMKCGNPVQPDQESAATVMDSSGEFEEAYDDSNEQANQSTSSDEKSNQTNEYVEKSKERAISYWGFVKENLKDPAKRGLNHKAGDYVFGYINIAVFALFFGLAAYFQSSQAMSGLSAFGMGEVSFFETFFTIFLYSIATSLVGVALIFAVLKFVMKLETPFHDVLGRFGALYTIPTVLTVGFFIIAAIPGLYILLGLFTLLLMAGMQIALILTLFTFHKSGKTSFDPIYGLFLVYVGYAIFVGLTSDIAAGLFLGGLVGF